MKAIEVVGLEKKYKNGVLALDGLNLEVQSGEVFALLGPNGAGKSSLLNILTTFYMPTGGYVKVLGKDVVKDAIEVRKDIACVAQRISIDEHMSLMDNMFFQSRLYKIDKSVARKNITSLIGCFGLEKYLKYPVASYSGGIKRRLDIAMNMVSLPKILFLDEPTVGMDIESRKSMWDMLRQIKGEYKTTILLTTHYLEEADSLSDTICIMNNGKEIRQDTPQNLKKFTRMNLIKIGFFNNETCNKAQVFLKDMGIFIYKKEINSIYLVSDKNYANFKEIGGLMVKNDMDFCSLEISQPTLEDVFFSMVNGGKGCGQVC